jgi:hypothetical protein
MARLAAQKDATARGRSSQRYQAHDHGQVQTHFEAQYSLTGQFDDIDRWPDDVDELGGTTTDRFMEISVRFVNSEYSAPAKKVHTAHPHDGQALIFQETVVTKPRRVKTCDTVFRKGLIREDMQQGIILPARTETFEQLVGIAQSSTNILHLYCCCC